MVRRGGPSVQLEPPARSGRARWQVEPGQAGKALLARAGSWFPLLAGHRRQVVRIEVGQPQRRPALGDPPAAGALLALATLLVHLLRAEAAHPLHHLAHLAELLDELADRVGIG